MKTKDTIPTYSKARTLMKRTLTSAGFQNIKISNKYYCFSGFASFKDKVIYFSCNDAQLAGVNRILIRTAKDYTDFTGGSNNFCTPNSQEINKLAKSLVK